ncbi:hypothetical protein INT47_010782 [Mucor saturninus]|uniref:Uncharacterized protein n=1 Tax=Mucor saturninus TaxID=64648 RepID=A0A8H7QQ02_9FUNG|nr:hypothetical protein INT47_010782 [Mucor saturninus]
MDHKYQRLDVDPALRKSYSSIAPSSELDTRATSWLRTKCDKLLGSDKLVFFHEKQRAYKARQKPGVVQIFLSSVILFFIALFSIRALLSCGMFQTDSVILLSSSSNDIVDLLKELPSSESIRELFYHYASNSHLAASPNDHDLAKWTRNKFTEFGLKNASIDTYYPFINYPIERKLAIVSGPQDLLYKASLRETNERDSSPTFHAYSADGNVTGPIVYVNYGRIEDFVLLVKNEIELKGSICLIRHGVIPSSIKVQNAETFGCIGALVYTDPQVDDKTSTVVHRDSVQYGFIHPGDPFTPGYAATFNATRNETATNLPKIPSLPISWNDALPLLRATQDLGFIEPTWVGQGVDEVRYFTGPSIALCNMVNVNDFQMKPIWNVLAHIPGHEEHNKAIIIGNHRDAWDHGAADPSSGSAVLLELARVFGILLEKGWKPRRSIILASWDANEYGNVGSTEWVEEHMHWLDKEAVAYLNVDHAVTGSHFSAQASPLLNRLIVDVTSMVIDPKTSKSVYESWLDQYISNSLKKGNKKKEEDDDDDEGAFIEPLIQPIGYTPGLDSVAFFEHAGISSLSMSFDGDEYDVSHSAFDSIAWMEEFGDPTFEYHQTMVKIWGLMAMRLSSDTLLPLYPIDYALTMKHYLDQLTCDKPNKETGILKKGHNNKETNKTLEHELPKLSTALHNLYKSSIQFNTKMQGLDRLVTENKKGARRRAAKEISVANERLIRLERAFVQNHGLLVDRPWYRHALFAPSAKTGLIQAFPSIVESRELKDLKVVAEMEKTLAGILENAQSILTKGKAKKSHHSNHLEEDNDVTFDA